MVTPHSQSHDSQQGASRVGTARIHLQDKQQQPASTQAGGEFDQLFDKAEQLMQNIDQASSASEASVDSPSEPLPPDEPQTIAELDRTLAKNLDVLLEADYQSIDAVLDGVFEEQAVLVQKLGEPPPPELPPEPVVEPQRPTATAPPPEVQAVAKSAEPQSVVDLPAPALAVQASVATEVMPEALKMDSIDAPEAAEVVPDSARSPRARRPEPDETPVPSIDSTLQPRKLSFQWLHATWRALLARCSAMAAIPLRPLVSALMIISIPLRFVPTRLRTAVDWLAVSLLAWTPIVWIMVLTLGRGGQTRGETPEDHRKTEPTIAAKDHRPSGSAPTAAKAPTDHH
jgi:hypothetical protein